MKRKKERMSRETLLVNIAVTVLFLGICTAAAQVFFLYTQNSMSVAVFYILTVMLIARYTDGYVPGIVASFCGIILINYVFTYPYMNLNFSIEGYPVAFVGMMVTATVTSALTTRAKKQNQILKERDRMLAAAEKETMRANLLRAVSHDLRTPLTGIIGLADTYLDEDIRLTDEKKRQLVGSIREDAEWLLSMVENLLSVTRIREGDAKVNTSPEPLEEVVAEAVQRLRRRLPQARIQVRVPDEFLMVPMDPMLIEQVIMNLLENAVYHAGSPSPIELTVEKGRDEVIFRVRDYGRGIDPKRLPAIFDGSGIGENASGDARKGMGIGLSICKTIVNAHDGTIEAVNREQGAEFIFTLPLAKEAPAGDSPGHGLPEGFALPKLNVPIGAGEVYKSVRNRQEGS